MFFNDVYNKNGFMSESVVADEFNVELYAEEMTGELADTYEIIMESDAEFFNLQEKMMKLEHCAIVTENAMLLEEGKEGFGSKAKDAFKKMWEKVKAFFRKMREWLANVIQSDKKFLAKYGSKLQKTKNTTDFAWSTGGMKPGNISSLMNDMKSEIMSGADDSSEKGSIRDKAASKLLGGSVKEKDMKSEMVKKAQEGAKSISGSEVYGIVSGYRYEKSCLDTLEKQADAFFKAVISDIKGGADKTYYEASDKKDRKDKNDGKKVKVAKVYANTVTKYIGIFGDILKQRKNAARSAAAKLVGRKAADNDSTEDTKEETEETVSESFGFGNYENALDMF